ncbi:patatin-like phospholipase family protein [Bacillus methanolicus]|nr:patatin-like phospholipase family protein [Bacillus methanolicus]
MKRIGLVLAGGGGKGAYQIGVWKALREFGIEQNIKAIAQELLWGL